MSPPRLKGIWESTMMSSSSALYALYGFADCNSSESTNKSDVGLSYMIVNWPNISLTPSLTNDKL